MFLCQVTLRTAERTRIDLYRLIESVRLPRQMLTDLDLHNRQFRRQFSRA